MQAFVRPYKVADARLSWRPPEDAMQNAEMGAVDCYTTTEVAALRPTAEKSRYAFEIAS